MTIYLVATPMPHSYLPTEDAAVWEQSCGHVPPTALGAPPWPSSEAVPPPDQPPSLGIVARGRAVHSCLAGASSDGRPGLRAGLMAGGDLPRTTASVCSTLPSPAALPDPDSPLRLQPLPASSHLAGLRPPPPPPAIKSTAWDPFGHVLSGGLIPAQKCLPWRPHLLNLIKDMSLAVKEGPGALGSRCWTITRLTCASHPRLPLKRFTERAAG